jgi:DNA repair exonuclease SbcCD nuclease subunit
MGSVGIKVLVIGDPHFQVGAYEECEELIKRCIEQAIITQPDFIVVLGDILDTHETVRNSPWKQACKFIKALSDIAPTYVLMGNHDLINQNQFLTSNHFFGPLEEWDNVVIVDYPTLLRIADFEFVMCPYVPVGRFNEALEKLVGDQNYDWTTATCIFAHQEFRGVFYGDRESTKGDSWDESLPPIIVGHIHEKCKVGENIYYTGSSRQVKQNESPDKVIWVATFHDDGGLDMEEIDLGLKAKMDVVLDYTELKDFDYKSLQERYFIKVYLTGTSEQFQIFRKSQLYSKLTREGIKFGVKPLSDLKESTAINSILNIDDGTIKRTNGVLKYDDVFYNIVISKDDGVREMYDEIFST